MRRRPHNSGFVLLLVLMVVFLAGSLLAIIAQGSCRQSMAAGAAQRELQVGWGARSIAASLLPSAERLLGEQALVEEKVSTRVRHTIKLGDTRFCIVLSDEQAKANVNLLAHGQGKLNLPATLRKLQAPQRHILAVRLRPVAYDAGITGVPVRYAGFEQVFQFEHPSQLVGSRPEDPPAAARITCWGSGKINFRRAETAVMRAVLAGVLNGTQLKKADDFRKAVPDGTLAELIKHLEMDKEKAQSLESLLTDSSLCHALWVVAEGTTRNYYRFYVAQTGDAENDSQQWTFEW